jgi:hypothetical protein
LTIYNIDPQADYGSYPEAGDDVVDYTVPKDNDYNYNYSDAETDEQVFESFRLMSAFFQNTIAAKISRFNVVFPKHILALAV